MFYRILTAWVNGTYFAADSFEIIAISVHRNILLIYSIIYYVAWQVLKV